MSLGIDILSYFQVDNPLVPCIDPAFIGFHVLQKSELSSKMIPKAYPREKVGLFCTNQGAHSVIEYSDMPKAIQESLDDSGTLRFRAGSVAIHLFDRAFVERIGNGTSEDEFRLPYHKALKKISSINASEQCNSGSTDTTDSNMGVKFELFVFDALPLAKTPSSLRECARIISVQLRISGSRFTRISEKGSVCASTDLAQGCWREPGTRSLCTDRNELPLCHGRSGFCRTMDAFRNKTGDYRR